MLFMLSACTGGDVDYELAYDGDKLVINAWLTPDGADAVISHSLDPNQITSNSDTPYVADAYVWLADSADNWLADLMYTKSGRYHLDFPLSAGHAYRLFAEAPDYPSTASAPVLIPLPIKEIDSVKVVGMRELAGESLYLTELSWRDRSGATDFYLIGAYAQGSGHYELIGASPAIKDALVEQCDMHTEGAGLFTFSDNCFPGGAYQLPIYTTPRNRDFRVDTLVIEFGTTTEILHRYVNSLDQPGTFYESLFADPRPLVSNINGGYGVVVGKNTRLFYFPL